MIPLDDGPKRLEDLEAGSDKLGEVARLRAQLVEALEEIDRLRTRREATEMVREFHVKHGFPTRGSTEPWSAHGGDLLKAFAADMGRWTRILRSEEATFFSLDLGRQRVSLVAEELGELADACAEGMPIPVFDALCDLSYVVAGSAVVWGMPLERGVEEVHRSNMTKDIGEFKPVKDDARYSPPRLREVLGHRSETDGEASA